MPSRLDVVVKVKQREQDRKLESFADALGTWRTAQSFAYCLGFKRFEC